jgi:predicted MPP superfamily phosphohydrolase
VALPPFVFRWLTKTRVEPYRHGWYWVGGSLLYVTSGIGESFLPLRFGRPPEVLVLEGRT